MSFFKRAIAATVAVTMLSSSALAAEVVRPTDSLIAAPAVSGMVGPGTRVGAKIARKNDLLGSPLFLAFLGAVVITITTIIIVNHNNNSPTSPG